MIALSFSLPNLHLSHLSHDRNFPSRGEERHYLSLSRQKIFVMRRGVLSLLLSLSVTLLSLLLLCTLFVLLPLLHARAWEGENFFSPSPCCLSLFFLYHLPPLPLALHNGNFRGALLPTSLVEISMPLPLSCTRTCMLSSEVDKPYKFSSKYLI